MNQVLKQIVAALTSTDAVAMGNIAVRAARGEVTTTAREDFAIATFADVTGNEPTNESEADRFQRVLSSRRDDFQFALSYLGHLLEPAHAKLRRDLEAAIKRCFDPVTGSADAARTEDAKLQCLVDYLGDLADETRLERRLRFLDGILTKPGSTLDEIDAGIKVTLEQLLATASSEPLCRQPIDFHPCGAGHCGEVTLLDLLAPGGSGRLAPPRSARKD